jgi:hypothetical protein
MNVRRLTISAVFLLLALTIHPGGILQQHRVLANSKRPVPSLFGQPIALSDFDEDGLLDEARIDGSSFHKSVGILLSGSGKRSFLHFNAVRRNVGSLFAQDIDRDGSTDLIWADPLHASDVVVWLGDGCGKFERIDSSRFQGSDLGNTEIAAPDDSNQETAINSETDRPLDQALTQKHLDRTSSKLPSEYSNRLATSSPALGQPSGRSPPLNLL